MNEDIEKESQRSLEDILKQTREDLNKHKEACDKAIITPAEKKETTDSIKNFVAMLSSSDFAKKHETAINALRGSKESDNNKTLSGHIESSNKLLDLYVTELESLKSKESADATQDADNKTEKLKETVKKAGQSVNEERTKAEQALKKEAEEGKQAIIQESIKKADTTRVGKYLVTPYLQSKYVRGEKQSQRYDRAATGVMAWIGLDGLNTRLQAHQEAMNKKLTDLKKKLKPEEENPEEEEEKNPDWTLKKKKTEVEKFKEKLHDKKTVEERKGHLRSQCEKLTGKKIDHVKFDAFISKWLEDHKQERQQFIDHYAKLKAESKEGISIYNPLNENVSRGFLEAKAPFELFRALVSEWYISAGSIACEQVEVWGKTIIRYGMAFGGLVYNGISTVFWHMPVSEFSKFVQDKLDIKVNEHTRMLLRGIMYRHGGLFTNALATVGHAATAMTSYMLQNNTDDISKFSAFIKGGIMNDMNSQLKVIEQLEKKMANSGLFKDMPGVMDDARCKALGLKPWLTHLTAVTEQMKLNTIMILLSQKHWDATWFLDAISKLDAPLNKEILENLKANAWWDFDKITADPKKYREVLKGAMGKNLSETSGLMSEMQIKKWWIAATGNAIWINRIDKSIERDFIRQMSSYWKLQQEMVAGESVLDKFSLKSLKRASQLTEMCSLGDKSVLFINNPKDVASYFDEINKVVKKSPEIAKTLLSSLPILMVSKEVADSMNTATGITDVWAKILYGVWSLMPLVWPMMMLYHSADQKWEMKWDISGMVLWWIMLGRDGVSIISQFSKGALSGWVSWASKAVLKGMLQPLHDLRNLGTGIIRTGYVTGRVMIHGAEMLRKDPKWMAKAGINFIKNIWVRAWIAGWIAVWLSFLGKWIYDEIMNDATIDDAQKKLAKSFRDHPEKLEKELQKIWPTLTPDQKAEVTKFAIAKQCGVSLEMLPAGGGSKDGAFNIQVDPLWRNPSLLDKKASIEQHLSKLEGKSVSIHYYFENTDRCIDQYKNFLHKELFWEKERKQSFDVAKVEQYMLAQWFTQWAIDQWKQPGCKEPMATVFIV